jgi:hypothetical protein
VNAPRLLASSAIACAPANASTSSGANRNCKPVVRKLGGTAHTNVGEGWPAHYCRASAGRSHRNVSQRIRGTQHGRRLRSRTEILSTSRRQPLQTEHCSTCSTLPAPNRLRKRNKTRRVVGRRGKTRARVTNLPTSRGFECKPRTHRLVCQALRRCTSPDQCKPMPVQ